MYVSEKHETKERYKRRDGETKEFNAKIIYQ